MLGTSCVKAQSGEQTTVLPKEPAASMAGKEEGRGRGASHTGKPLEFPWRGKDRNLERVKQEADTV